MTKKNRTSKIPKIRAQSTEVAIVGGGVPGLAFAGLLHQAGIDVCVIDPQPPAPPASLAPSGRTVALLNSSLNILQAAGLEDPGRYGAPMRTMRLIDDSDPRSATISADFNAQDLGQSHYGINIPLNILRAQMTTRHQNLLYAATLKSCHVDEHGVHLKLAPGKTLNCRLIVGADGRKSLVRAQAGIDIWQHDYGQSAITFLIEHSHNHHSIAREFHRPCGPLALVPLPGRQSSVVWVMNTEEAQNMIRLKKAEFESAFQNSTKNALGRITLASTPECWPLIMIKAKRLTAPRTALIAEAAHVISPITAQGLNLSLRDAATLAQCIIDHLRLGLDVGDPAILDAYERARRPDLETRIYGVHSFHQMVSTKFSAVRGLRRTGLRLVDGIAPLKKIAMKAGLS